LDRNGDGKVNLQDLEDLCNKYLTSKIWSLDAYNWFKSKCFIELHTNRRADIF
jgi:hypothetical protein